MIESELAELEPPPIGDLVDNAIRDGRQLRRTRLVERGVACAAAIGVLVLGVGMATAALRPEEPPSGGGGYAVGEIPAEGAPPGVSATTPPSPARSVTAVPPDAPTVAIFDPGSRQFDTASKPPPAVPAVVLLALQSVLPRGTTVAYAGSRFDTYTGVQVFLDRGAGFGMVRVAMARYSFAPTCGSGPPGVVVNCFEDAGELIETFEIEANCVQRRGATVYRADGIAIQVNVGSCIVDGPWSPAGVDSVDAQVLDVSEAIKIGQDPIWSDRSLFGLSAQAPVVHPYLPLLTAFNGVGS